ncbi:mitochondrial DNA helicase [Arctopsyche grandis]|uniref:mitochondrial DNA helicase n=1 Tax=Arctopsyche grandis TaxID=121162 RepID=UPI00406D77F4
MSMTKKSLSYLRYKFSYDKQKKIYSPSVFERSLNYRQIHNAVNVDLPSVSVSDMRRSLRLHGFSVDDGFTCLLTKCPICKSLGKPSIGSAYINKVTGFFLCTTCDNSGQWSSLEHVMKHPKDWINTNIAESIVKINESFIKVWHDLTQETVPLSNIENNRLDEILNLFDFPVFPDASKLLADVRISLDNNTIYFPLQNASAQVVGYKKIENGSMSEITVPHNDCGGLFYLKGSRPFSKEHPVTIVPSINDALSIASQKLPGGAICLPYGVGNLPQQVLPALEKWPKLTLWIGVDTIEHVRNLTRKLGEARCLIVRATDVQPSAREALRQQMDLKSIISSAHPLWHKSIITFKNLREDVLSDLQNIDKVQGLKWKRYPTLNRLLRGHRRGELTVLTGPTGCGKTTFCSEYSLDLALQGVNTLWGSFEIRNARLARTMLQQLAGFPLEENLDKFDEYADWFQNLPFYFLMFHGQQSIKDVMEAVQHATYVHDIAHVVIDNVQFMLGIGDEPSKHSERFWRQDAVIAAFRTFATKTNCHVTLVMHPRKERDVDDLSTNSIFGSAKASQEADNVLIIQDKRLTAIKGKKYLQVAKNRYSGDLGIMPLEFDKQALSYAQKKKTQTKDQETN